MLDNLRDQATFKDDEPLEPEAPQPERRRRRRQGFDQVTGTTPQQRFLLALMFFMVVFLMGLVFLFLTGKIVPPI